MPAIRLRMSGKGEDIGKMEGGVVFCFIVIVFDLFRIIYRFHVTADPPKSRCGLLSPPLSAFRCTAMGNNKKEKRKKKKPEVGWFVVLSLEVPINTSDTLSITTQRSVLVMLRMLLRDWENVEEMKFWALRARAGDYELRYRCGSGRARLLFDLSGG